MDFLTRDEIEQRLDHVREAPSEQGSLEMIVARPAEDSRRVLEQARLTFDAGVEGDNWQDRGEMTEAGRDTQVALINTRYLDIIGGGRERWPLAGDQLYVDMDIGVDNLPPGTRLAIGNGVLEITEVPHTGCAKFSRRFGTDALRFVNSPAGKELRLRGVYARVVQEGDINAGATVRKL